MHHKLAVIFISVLAVAAILPCVSQPYFGNGIVGTEARSLPPFRSIALSGAGTLNVHHGAQSLTISLDSNLLPLLETKVIGTRLVIGFREGSSVNRLTKLQVEISLPDLEGVDVSGSAKVKIDPFAGTAFTSRLSGSSSLAADLSYKSIEVQITGSGRIELKGSADKVTLGISGSGSIRAEGLVALSEAIRVSGSGSAELRAKSSLLVDISGSSSVLYWGSPEVERRISGSAILRRAGD